MKMVFYFKQAYKKAQQSTLQRKLMMSSWTDDHFVAFIGTLSYTGRQNISHHYWVSNYVAQIVLSTIQKKAGSWFS